MRGRRRDGAERDAAGGLHHHPVHHHALPGADPRRHLLQPRPGDHRRHRSRAVLRRARPHPPFLRGYCRAAGAAGDDGVLPVRSGRAAGRVAAAWHDGPVYVRLGKKAEPALHPEPLEFRLGRANTLRAGTDVCLIATGTLMPEVLRGAELLAAAAFRRGSRAPHRQAAGRGPPRRDLLHLCRGRDGRGARPHRRPLRRRRRMAGRPRPAGAAPRLCSPSTTSSCTRSAPRPMPAAVRTDRRRHRHPDAPGRRIGRLRRVRVGIDFDNTLVRYDDLFHRRRPRGRRHPRRPAGQQGWWSSRLPARHRPGRGMDKSKMQGTGLRGAHGRGGGLCRRPRRPRLAGPRAPDWCCSIISHKTRVPFRGPGLRPARGGAGRGRGRCWPMPAGRWCPTSASSSSRPRPGISCGAPAPPAAATFVHRRPAGDPAGRAGLPCRQSTVPLLFDPEANHAVDGIAAVTDWPSIRRFLEDRWPSLG